MSAAHLLFKQNVRNVHRLQRNTIEVCYKMMRLPYQWTPAANHFISSTKQSSARQHWSVWTCISLMGSCIAPIHDNPLDLDIENSVAIRLF